MSDLQLIAASIRDSAAVYAMLQEIGPGENGFGNIAYGLSYSAYQEHLRLLERHAKGLNLTPDRVPQTTYWLMQAGYPLGVSKLRHVLNEALHIQGGHIGYCIRPSVRGRGLGHIILQLTLNEARNLGLSCVLLTVTEHNTASRRVIEKNNGVLERIDQASGICYYWIDLYTPLPDWAV
jgi:predicted acetyltransferase